MNADQLKVFWDQYCDRRYMKNTIYPAIGNFLKTNKTKRILDIGAEWFNINTIDLFKMEQLDYWVIDIKKAPDQLKCSHFIQDSVLNLDHQYPELKGYFDVVISFGVLGFYQFEKDFVNNYLFNLYQVLRPGGIFLLKLDTFLIEKWEDKYQIDFAIINQYFSPFITADLPMIKVVEDESRQYTFFTFSKK